MPVLSRGDDRLIVSPERGGAITGWTWRGTHLLRPSADAVLSCFPLVPYCNRIAYRRFTWAGQSYELAANFGDHPHAIHGVGWQLPWQVDNVSSDSVTLSLRHDAQGESARGWPFAFIAHLTYQLTDDGLSIRIEATNLHAEPAPMGLGVHPYFPRPDGATIAFQADGVWINRDALPVTHEPVPAAWNHTHGRAADREPLDNCFTGWRGPAIVPHLRIEADPMFGNLQVFTPTGADFLCVEPMSHVPDAINHPELSKVQAMTALGSEQSLSGSIMLRRAT